MESMQHYEVAWKRRGWVMEDADNDDGENYDDVNDDDANNDGYDDDYDSDALLQ